MGLASDRGATYPPRQCPNPTSSDRWCDDDDDDAVLAAMKMWLCARLAQATNARESGSGVVATQPWPAYALAPRAVAAPKSRSDQAAAGDEPHVTIAVRSCLVRPSGHLFERVQGRSWRAGIHLAVALALAIPVGLFPAVAWADHEARPSTANLEARGHSPHAASFTDPAPVRHVNSDLAFWGTLAFHGNYDGFRIVDISNPDGPVGLSHERCNGDQGDIVVWETVLVRAWHSPAPAGRFCDGVPVPAGFEGVHVFDIRDTSDAKLVASVELECGSHTLTAAGVADGSLIVYSNNSSSLGCVDGTRASDDSAGDFMDIITIPLGSPASASLLRREPLAGPATDVRTGCHDAGVILGQVNKAACAGADTINVWDVGPNATPGGTPTEPVLLLSISEPGVGQAGTNGRWHSAAFTEDGKVLVAGWEPGGGEDSECEASDPDLDKSLFFYDASTGAKLGHWVLPRPQGADENCTVHGYNIMPLSGRYLALSGNFQAGTWVTDFTDPAKPVTAAWSDPASLGPGPFCDPDRDGPGPGRCQQGGAWASYWYNGFIYESDTTKGLNVFAFSDREAAGALRLPHMNPQTQEIVTRPSGRDGSDPGSVPPVSLLVVGGAVFTGFLYGGWRLFRRATGMGRRA